MVARRMEHIFVVFIFGIIIYSSDTGNNARIRTTNKNWSDFDNDKPAAIGNSAKDLLTTHAFT